MFISVISLMPLLVIFNTRLIHFKIQKSLKHRFLCKNKSRVSGLRLIHFFYYVLGFRGFCIEDVVVELDETVCLSLTRQQSTMGSGIVFPVRGLASKQHLQRLLERGGRKKHRLNHDLTVTAAKYAQNDNVLERLLIF